FFKQKTAYEMCAVVKRGLGHGDVFDLPSLGPRVRNDASQVSDRERQQDTVPACGIRVDANDRLTIQILHGVRDEPILAEHDDRILFAENEIGQETSIKNLDASQTAEEFFGLLNGCPISLMLAQVVAKIGA